MQAERMKMSQSGVSDANPSLTIHLPAAAAQPVIIAVRRYQLPLQHHPQAPRDAERETIGAAHLQEHHGLLLVREWFLNHRDRVD